jgi:hypothetical protein
MRTIAVWAGLALLIGSTTAGCDGEGEDPENPTPAADDDTSDDPPPYDDADGDGVPDVRDRCADSQPATLTDARGCTAAQRSGCAISQTAPGEGEAFPGGDVTFSFEGDCDGYRLYASSDPGLPIHAVHLLGTAAEEGSLTVARDDLPPAPDGTLYWTVEGSARGHRFTTPPRSFHMEAP